MEIALWRTSSAEPEVQKNLEDAMSAIGRGGLPDMVAMLGNLPSPTVRQASMTKGSFMMAFVDIAVFSDIMAAGLALLKTKSPFRMLDTGSPLLSKGTVITVLESVVEVAPNHLGPNQCGGYTEFIRFKHAGLGLCLGKHRFGARTKKIIFTTPNVVLSQNIAVRHATTRKLSFSGKSLTLVLCACISLQVSLVLFPFAIDREICSSRLCARQVTPLDAAQQATRTDTHRKVSAAQRMEQLKRID